MNDRQPPDNTVDKRFQAMLAESTFYEAGLQAYLAEHGNLPDNPAGLIHQCVLEALSSHTPDGRLKQRDREKLLKRLGRLAFNISETTKVSTDRVQAAGWLFRLRYNPNWTGKVKKEQKRKQNR
jgi:hypothetical protein